MAGAADINTAADAAVVAIRAGDYGTALTQALAAQALLAAVPDSIQGVGGGATELRWGRQAINELVINIRRQQSIAGGMQQTKIIYARPTDP